MSNTQRQNKSISRFIPKIPVGAIITVYNTTSSMAPTIAAGQEIRIYRIDFDHISIGDIIAYTKGKRRRIIIHRAVRRVGPPGPVGYVTKGDNVPTEDRYTVYAQDFIGIVKDLTGAVFVSERALDKPIRHSLI